MNVNIFQLKGEYGAWSENSFACFSHCYIMCCPLMTEIVTSQYPLSRDACCACDAPPHTFNISIFWQTICLKWPFSISWVKFYLPIYEYWGPVSQCVDHQAQFKHNQSCGDRFKACNTGVATVSPVTFRMNNKWLLDHLAVALINGQKEFVELKQGSEHLIIIKVPEVLEGCHIGSSHRGHLATSGSK